MLTTPTRFCVAESVRPSSEAPASLKDFAKYRRLFCKRVSNPNFYTPYIYNNGALRLTILWSVVWFYFISAMCNYHQYCITLLWASDAIRRQITGSTLAQVMACCLMVPSRFQTNVDLSSARPCGIYLQAILQDMLKLTLWRQCVNLCQLQTQLYRLWLYDECCLADYGYEAPSSYRYWIIVHSIKLNESMI